MTVFDGIKDGINCPVGGKVKKSGSRWTGVAVVALIVSVRSCFLQEKAHKRGEKKTSKTGLILILAWLLDKDWYNAKICCQLEKASSRVGQFMTVLLVALVTGSHQVVKDAVSAS